MSREDANEIAKAAERARRRSRAPLKVLLPTVAALGAGAAIAVGAIPGSGGTITGCYQTVTQGANDDSPTTPFGTLRLIDPSANTGTDVDTSVYSCDSNEATITWNQTGPQGPPGQNGQNGQNGAQGPAGSAGPAGPAGSVEVQAGASSQVFLKLEGVTGEATQKAHAGEIQLESFSIGPVTHSSGIGSATSGAGAGKVSVATFKVVKQVDSASPALFHDLVSGAVIKQADISVDRLSGDKLVHQADYKLSNVFITSIEEAGASKPPTEMVDGTYQKIEFSVVVPAAGGTGTKTVTTSWNQVTNRTS